MFSVSLFSAKRYFFQISKSTKHLQNLMCWVFINNCWIGWYYLILMLLLGNVFHVQQTVGVSLSGWSSLSSHQSHHQSYLNAGGKKQWRKPKQLTTTTSPQDAEDYPVVLYHLLECVSHFSLSTSVFITISCTIERHQVKLFINFKILSLSLCMLWKILSVDIKIPLGLNTWNTTLHTLNNSLEPKQVTRESNNNSLLSRLSATRIHTRLAWWSMGRTSWFFSTFFQPFFSHWSSTFQGRYLHQQ